MLVTSTTFLNTPRPAWLVWEYVITFDREVALVWSRKVNSASMLFLLNRYIMLVQFAVQLPLSFTISDEVRLTHSPPPLF